MKLVDFPFDRLNGGGVITLVNSKAPGTLQRFTKCPARKMHSIFYPQLSDKAAGALLNSAQLMQGSPRPHAVLLLQTGSVRKGSLLHSFDSLCIAHHTTKLRLKILTKEN